MRVWFGLFFLIGVAAGSMSAQAAETLRPECRTNCIYIMQRIDGADPALFALTCDRIQRNCSGKGRWKIFGEDVSVAVNAKFGRTGVQMMFMAASGLPTTQRFVRIDRTGTIQTEDIVLNTATESEPKNFIHPISVRIYVAHFRPPSAITLL